jgi:predicted signal transduction protein with EAL and GGDEF domain
MVAQRLFNLLGDQDIVCRMGGDEFALVLQRPDARALPLIAESITKLFAEPFAIESQEVSITCSLGVSIYPDHAADQDTLVRNADIAMYQAKLGGKNTFQFFTAEMSRALQRRTAIEKGLRNAIAADELTLNFQPQYDLHNLELVGVEALLRWHSAELGSVAPTEFIPIAEESGLIISIGEWVLQSACRQMAEWRQLGLLLPVMSINFSAKQLRAPNLAQHILAVVEQAQIDPRLIEIELTESIMMENLHSLIDDFSTLQQQGIKLSIDDFGTGYSSMAYLKRLPLDRIKIDRAFVRDLPHNANDREIVAAMIAMAHNLGLSVTAEGVEQKNQADFLREIGCDTVQGFYFGKPMPASELQILLPASMGAVTAS